MVMSPSRARLAWRMANVSLTWTTSAYRRIAASICGEVFTDAYAVNDELPDLPLLHQRHYRRIVIQTMKHPYSLILSIIVPSAWLYDDSFLHRSREFLDCFGTKSNTD